MPATNSTDSNLGQTIIQPAFVSPAGPAASMPAAAAKVSPENQNVPARAMALVEGSDPDFSQETNAILRDRLRQVALILFVGYSAFLLKALIFSSHQVPIVWWICVGLLTVTTATMGVVWFRMCRQCHFLQKHLRGVEWLIFGTSALLFFGIGYAQLLGTSQEGYLEDVTPPWLLLIFIYSLFIPNHWTRALRVVIPMAFGPLAVLLLAWVSSPVVKDLIENTDRFHHVFLETIMAMTFASASAILGVRMIRALREKAFEAQQLGQYRLKRLLGRGGMGEVYLAEHLMLKRPCAIKIIRPEKAGDPATLARFEWEVQATAKLTHWNTVEIYDFGRTEDGTFYYVMEYLPGMSLDQVVEMHGPMDVARVLHLLVQTCEALSEAHQQCLVHRDIKPANIFAAKRGGAYDIAKLLDFGLVRSLQSDGDPHLTHESVVTGSPLYMSPEQARGDEIDHRSDIYALGCTAYFLLTGRPPFQESSAIKLLLAHAQQQPEPPSTFNAAIAADLEEVILKCLEKSADNRFVDVLALRDALAQCHDYGNWTRQSAREWWQYNGCPRKLELDRCVSAGIELKEVPEEVMATTAELCPNG